MISEGTETRKTQDRMIALWSQDRDVNNRSMGDDLSRKERLGRRQQAEQRSWGSESPVIKKQQGG